MINYDTISLIDLIAFALIALKGDYVEAKIHNQIEREQKQKNLLNAHKRR